MRSISRNRANWKHYEGELIEVLWEIWLHAKVGPINEEIDVILPEHDILLEVKSTPRKNFRFSVNQKNKGQFYRPSRLPLEFSMLSDTKEMDLNGGDFIQSQVLSRFSTGMKESRLANSQFHRVLSRWRWFLRE